MKEINYNKIPVFFCGKCLSPAIKCDSATEPAIEGRLNDEYRYCKRCGSTNIRSLLFTNWQDLYVDTYGLTYLEDHDL